jgi:hypothetical protein
MFRLRTIQLSAVTALLLQSAAAGTLDDFEEKAERRPEKKKESRSKQSDDYASFGSGTYPSDSGGDSFLESVWVWMVSSPFVYQHDDPSVGMLTGEDLYAEMLESEEIEVHRPGMFVLPYVRADYNWQHIDSNLDAQDIHLELGYKALAFHGRHTRYTESNPSDHLDINQYYALLRFAGVALDGSYPIRSWEMHLGGGVVQLRGNSEHSSGAVTVPILIYPTDWLGLEFRPAWYRPQDRTIGDYDLSASLGSRYVHVRLGYRWLWMQGEGTWLNGPYAGVSLSF